MARQSCGLLLHRRRSGRLEVLLVHPGGPYWARRDLGAWSIPKGEPEPGEEPLAAARREVAEEVGIAPPGPFLPLPPCRQKGGKLVLAWAAEGDCDPAAIRPNTVLLEWPPRSGRMQEVPEIDRAEWFGLDEARQRINPAQRPLLDALAALS